MLHRANHYYQQMNLGKQDMTENLNQCKTGENVRHKFNSKYLSTCMYCEMCEAKICRSFGGRFAAVQVGRVFNFSYILVHFTRFLSLHHNYFYTI